jgi:hypothetical protein
MMKLPSTSRHFLCLRPRYSPKHTVPWHLQHMFSPPIPWELKCHILPRGQLQLHILAPSIAWATPHSEQRKSLRFSNKVPEMRSQLTREHGITVHIWKARTPTVKRNLRTSSWWWDKQSTTAQKPSVAQAIKTLPCFGGLHKFFTALRKLPTGPYHESDESNQHPHPISLRFILILILPPTSRSPKSLYFLGFPIFVRISYLIHVHFIFYYLTIIIISI